MILVPIPLYSLLSDLKLNQKKVINNLEAVIHIYLLFQEEDSSSISNQFNNRTDELIQISASG